jgi:hypothetical protein
MASGRISRVSDDQNDLVSVTDLKVDENDWLTCGFHLSNHSAGKRDVSVSYHS